MIFEDGQEQLEHMLALNQVVLEWGGESTDSIEPAYWPGQLVMLRLTTDSITSMIAGLQLTTSGSVLCFYQDVRVHWEAMCEEAKDIRQNVQNLGIEGWKTGMMSDYAMIKGEEMYAIDPTVMACDERKGLALLKAVTFDKPMPLVGPLEKNLGWRDVVDVLEVIGDQDRCTVYQHKERVKSGYSSVRLGAGYERVQARSVKSRIKNGHGGIVTHNGKLAGMIWNDSPLRVISPSYFLPFVHRMVLKLNNGIRTKDAGEMVYSNPSSSWE
ncbi:MAG: hypothetical protein QF486_03725 [Candidatus Woesearchaeota archaeon]|nr:hypothetical protein [Candidatus Woesearchaeota archaeon]MDP7182088.1 hypothetical protein [Candidatus Woesearchaeota archaeon]MDP7198706.1 hypothetical protein [Candidatus Woesearchaeota archaeon]MDP7467680.1 hypothetical protein [Candidatus Woesearchaeota archaeon]MDP7647249.1 hypothetical protein [Candidatus Woesearchaeota archaeon]